ncbi:MAG: hypothetical protein U1F36_21260 [Planctomycetota bacterium]
MRNGLLIFAALAVVVMVVVLLWGEGERRSIPQPQAGARSTHVEETAAGDVRHAADSPESPPRPATLPDGRAEVATPAPEGDFELRVVDGVTKAAVPHARVWAIGRERSKQESRKLTADQLRGSDPLQLLKLLVKPQVADADGVLRLSSKEFRGGGMIAATDREDEAGHAHRSGFKSLQQDPGEFLSAALVLVLDADDEVRVRVIEGGGRAVPGVEVRALLGEDGRKAGFWKGTSDRAGIVTMSRIRQLARNAAGDAFGPDRTIRFQVHALLKPLPCVDVSLGDLPRDAVDLLLPPHGSVSLELDPDPAKPQGHGTASLWDDGAEGFGAVLEDGRCSFPIVGLSRALHLQVRREGALRSQSIDFEGPVAPGQDVHVRVPIAEEGGVVAVRLLDEEQTPLRDVDVQMSFFLSAENRERASSDSSRSDGEGRIRFLIQDEWRQAAEQSTATAKVSVDLHERTMDRGGRIVVSAPFPVREIDLGDVVLVRAPVIAAGRVLDVDGRPIEGVILHASGASPAKTGVDGAFELRAHGVSKAFRIQAGKQGYQDAHSQPLEVGARGIELRLERATDVAGTVLLDDLGTTVRLSVDLSESGRASARPGGINVRDGRFGFSDVRHDRCDVALYLQGRREPIEVRSHIELQSGRQNELPPFDLRGRLHAIRFGVVGEDGAAISGASALFAAPVGGEGKPRFEGVQIEGGLGRIVCDQPSADVLVFAEDHVAVRVPALRDGDRVVLGPRPRLMVTLAAGRSLPAGARIVAEMKSTDTAWPADATYEFFGSRGSRGGSRPWGIELPLALEASGRGSFPIPAPGPYSLSWWLYGSGEKRPLPASLPRASPTEIEIPVGCDHVDCVLDFDQDAAEVAANRLR